MPPLSAPAATAMMFMIARVLLLASVGAEATRLSADSVQGRRLLERAFVVKESKFLSSRRLNDDGDANDADDANDAEANDNANANANGQANYGSLSSKTIKYIGCSSYNAYAGGADQQGNGGEAQEEGEDWWYYQYQAQNDGLEPANYVRFTLCSGSECSGECSGEYVLNMEEFMEDYTEWKMEYDKFWCERVRENCVCNAQSSWEDCYTDCFAQKGLTYDECLAANANGNDNVFQIQQYLECSGIKFYNPDYMYQNYNNNFQWANFFYLGLTCENNKDVVLKPFYDEDCSYPADNDQVQQAMGSYNSIPYLEGTPVLGQGQCVACVDAENEVNRQGGYDNNGDYYNNYYGENWEEGWEDQVDATDLCEMVTNINGDSNAVVCDDYNQKGCEWIHNTLPSLDGRFHFNYAQSIAAMKDQLARSERLQWTLFAVCLILFGVLAASIGYNCSNARPKGPKNRAALLEYRRENATSMELS